MMIRLASRALKMKPSPTLGLTAKAKELADQGHDVISLSLGEPDWDTFEFVKEAGIAAIRKGATKYTAPAGLPKLRQTIAQVTSEQLAVRYEASEVTVTAGSKFIIFAALQMLAQEGDEVIVPAPYWVSYPTMVELTGALPVCVSCDRSTNFKLSAAKLESAITPRTRVLIINSPSNPTGEYYSAEELRQLAEVLRRYPQVIILSDDIYNRLVFEKDKVAPHLLQVAPDLRDRMIVINGVSKSYSMTGWRLGWAAGPASIIKAMTDYQSQSVSCAAEFTQLAAIEALQKGEADLQKAVENLKQRRDLACAALQTIPRLKLEAPRGAFYLWPDISGFFGATWKGQEIADSRRFAEILLSEFKVAAVPGVDFGLEGYLRLSFVDKPERLQEAARRLKAMCAELHS